MWYHFRLWLTQESTIVDKSAGAAEAPSLPQHVAFIDPTHSNADLVVERVYPQPTSEENETLLPDVKSHVDFTGYAFSRFEPRDMGKTPTVVTYPITENVDRQVGDGWIADWGPKKAAGLFLASMALFNVVGNGPSALVDAKEAALPLFDRAKNAVTRWLGFDKPPSTLEVTTTIPGDIYTKKYTYRNPAGDSAPKPANVDNLLAEIRANTQNGTTLTQLVINGESSDEWGRDKETLTKAESKNNQLAIDRAGNFGANTLDRAQATDTPLPNKIKTTAEQSILDEATAKQLLEEAADYNISFEHALALYKDNPKALPAKLSAMLDLHIGSKRGVTVHATYEESDTYKHETITVKEPETPRENTDRNYGLYLGIPTPFWPRSRREQYARTSVGAWVRPGADPDQRWMELYKEVMQPDGTLPRDAWKYTRKYNLLAREDRIDYVLTHHFTDGDGEQRDIRVMFVDHDPTEDTLTTFKELLTSLSEMRGGTVPKYLSAITVFPREQSGTDQTVGRDSKQYPHRPKDIGLGIDKQERIGVMGEATPALGLIEVHMPENPTQEQLRGYLGTFFVVAHEAAGHFTDTKEQPVGLRPVGPPEARHYMATDPWADVAEEAFPHYLDVDARGNRYLTVTWQTVTPEGEVLTLTDEVKGNDPRVAVSQHAILHDRLPTKYAGQSAGELYGDVAGQVVSGALIPYEEADIKVDARHPSLARGYAVDRDLQYMFEERTGWNPRTARPVIEDEFTLTTAHDDPMLREFIDNARRTPMPDDRITILSGVASRAAIAE
jgi:hypothetical protein